MAIDLLWSHAMVQRLFLDGRWRRPSRPRAIGRVRGVVFPVRAEPVR